MLSRRKIEKPAAKAVEKDAAAQGNMAGKVTAGPVAARGDTACIITCHNYGRYLRQCIQSCLTQSLPFRYILVVDDGSTDETAAVAAEFAGRGVRYERVEYLSASKARAHGPKALPPTAFTLWVDADNWLPSEFHAVLRSRMGDPHVGVAYPSILRVTEAGVPERLVSHVHAFDADRFRRRNHVDTCALVRREAYEQSRGWLETPGGMEDWVLFLSIRAAGWKFAYCPEVPLHYRAHGQSKTAGARARPDHGSGAMQRGLQISLVTLFAGREWMLPRYFEWLRALEWDKENLTLVAVDNSRSESFRAKLQAGLSRSGLRYVYVRDDSVIEPEHGALEYGERRDLRRANGWNFNQHLCRLYATARRSMPAGTDLVWSVEDDVEVPPHGLRRLVQIAYQRDDAGVVCGMLRNRFLHESGKRVIMVWRELMQEPFRVEFIDSPVTAEEGSRTVIGSGFYCTLFRREVWDGLVFHPSLDWAGGRWAYDWAASWDVRTSGQAWVCSDVMCKHWQEDGTYV